MRGLLRFRESVRRTALPADDDPTGLRDHLTGTWTRRAMTAFVQQEVLRCERHGGEFGVLGIELLGFRRFRREFGRKLADRLVVHANTLLLQSSREAGLVARMADIRFAVLLRHAPAGVAVGMFPAGRALRAGPFSGQRPHRPHGGLARPRGPETLGNA